MNSQIKQILKLNKKFYHSVSKDFSNTRRSDWRGWYRALDTFQNYGGNGNLNIKILDLGCGNGRLLTLLESKFKRFTYTGYDTNNDLLSDAKVAHKEIGKNKMLFVKKDVISNLSKIRAKYDLVCCFGLTHHIPDQKFRLSWFSSLAGIVSKGGILICTFWDFERRSGDYLVDWDNKNIARYCHKYSKKELGEIVKIFTKKGFTLIDKYSADNSNTYMIFGNI
jgi:SAM-dependent methyltransferase